MILSVGNTYKHQYYTATNVSFFHNNLKKILFINIQIIDLVLWILVQEDNYVTQG